MRKNDFVRVTPKRRHSGENIGLKRSICEISEEMMEEKILICGGEIHVWYDVGYDAKVKTEGMTRRDVDRLAVREKLDLLGVKSLVVYDEAGAPALENGAYGYISISHFRGWYALLLSEREGGIDIQPYKKTLMAGRDYFVNVREQQYDYDNKELYLVWAAKEAFYKYRRGRIADLKNEVTVEGVEKEDKRMVLRYENEVFFLRYRTNDTYVLVYFVEKAESE